MIFSVTSSIFYKKIEEFTQVRKTQKTFGDGPIANTQIWNHNTTVSPNIMYLILAEDLETNHKRFKDNFIVCAGNYDSGQYPLVSGCDLIICPRLTDLSSLVNIIFTIHNQFRSWRNTVNNIYLTTNSFSEVFKASRELFNMDFFLMTTDYDILAVSERFYGHKKIYGKKHSFSFSILKMMKIMNFQNIFMTRSFMKLTPGMLYTKYMPIIFLTTTFTKPLCCLKPQPKNTIPVISS